MGLLRGEQFVLFMGGTSIPQEKKSGTGAG